MNRIVISEEEDLALGPGLITQSFCVAEVSLQWKRAEKASDTDIRRGQRVPPLIVLSRPFIHFYQTHSHNIHLKLTSDNEINKIDSEVAQSCPTLCDPIDWGLPGSSIHGILQARILEWVAISFSRGSSGPRDHTQVSCIGSRSF